MAKVTQAARPQRAIKPIRPDSPVAVRSGVPSQLLGRLARTIESISEVRSAQMTVSAACDHLRGPRQASPPSPWVSGLGNKEEALQSIGTQGSGGKARDSTQERDTGRLAFHSSPGV